MRKLHRSLRNVGNIANLSTPLGLTIAYLGSARTRAVEGLIVADCARLPFLRASAMTVGSVVLIPRRGLEDMERRIPGLLEHEEGHAYQWAYSFGLPFIPLYALATVWSWLSTGDRAAGNVFEIQADLVLGGYAGRSEARRPVIRGLLTRLSGAVARRSVRPGAANAADAVA